MQHIHLRTEDLIARPWEADEHSEVLWNGDRVGHCKPRVLGLPEPWPLVRAHERCSVAASSDMYSRTGLGQGKGAVEIVRAAGLGVHARSTAP